MGKPRLFSEYSIAGADLCQHTRTAKGPLGFAGLSAMLDKQDMAAIGVFSGGYPFHLHVCSIHGNLFPY